MEAVPSENLELPDRQQGFFIAIVDGEVQVTPVDMPIIAAPTLLRMGAQLVESKLGL